MPHRLLAQIRIQAPELADPVAALVDLLHAAELVGDRVENAVYRAPWAARFYDNPTFKELAHAAYEARQSIDDALRRKGA